MRSGDLEPAEGWSPGPDLPNWNGTLGAGSVSFGLAERPGIHTDLLALGIQGGAACSITDPEKIGQSVRSADLLLRRDTETPCAA